MGSLLGDILFVETRNNARGILNRPHSRFGRIPRKDLIIQADHIQ